LGCITRNRAGILASEREKIVNDLLDLRVVELPREGGHSAAAHPILNGALNHIRAQPEGNALYIRAHRAACVEAVARRTALFEEGFARRLIRRLRRRRLLSSPR